MKANHTDITIVLDRSGSMSSVAADTIGGFNRFLDDQRQAPGTAALTLHLFDNVFETVIQGQDVKSAPKLTGRTFVPRGNTPLLDAIGRAINGTGARLSAKAEPERAEKVVFVIITDGHENASCEYGRPKVFAMITHQREAYSWEFVFLGANQDAIATAADIGVTAGNAMTFAHNDQGTQSAFASTSANLVQMRSCTKDSMSYTAADRESQRQAGAKP